MDPRLRGDDSYKGAYIQDEALVAYYNGTLKQCLLRWMFIMGTYLVTGIVQDITIRKKDIETYDIDFDEVVGKLNKEVDMNCYTFTEDDLYYYWNIIPKTLECNLADFLDAQFQMYDKEKTQNTQNMMNEVVNQVRGAKTGEQLLALAAEKRGDEFRIIEHVSHFVSVRRKNGFQERIKVYYRLISIFMDGKIIMECYNNILSYFEQTIRLQRDKYPIVNCVKVMITD